MDKIELRSETKTFTILSTTAPPKVPTWWLLAGLSIACAIGTIIIASKKAK